MDMTTTRAHRGLLPQTLSHNYMQIIRRMRRYKNIPKKDGTLTLQSSRFEDLWRARFSANLAVYLKKSELYQ